MATPRVITMNDILDGHVGLDLECFDRIYPNGWVPNLQVSGQVRWTTGSPVGSENPVISCDLHVLVDEAAEPVSP